MSGFGNLDQTAPRRQKGHPTWKHSLKQFLVFRRHHGLTRNSAIADKPRDAFVRYGTWNGVADLQGPKTRPSPYVLPRRIRSFYVEWCRHKWRRTQNLGALGLRPFGMRGVSDPKTRPTHMCYLPNVVVLGQTIRALLRRSA